jgi:hypothetical protein
VSTLKSIDELCALVRHCVIWEDDDLPVTINADTELLVMGLLDSLTIRRIVAELAAVGVNLPDSSIVAATFRSPAALWRVITGLGSGA